jgi:hypothetical protein
LTGAQRLAWNDFAVSHPDLDWTGNLKRISGFNWYIRINVSLHLAQLDLGEYIPGWWIGPRDDPPTNFDFIQFTLDAKEYSPGIGLHIDWIMPWMPSYTWMVELYVTSPLSAGRNPTIKQADRKIATQYDNNFVDFYVDQPGRYTCFLRLLNVHGMVDSWVRCSIDVTA